MSLVLRGIVGTLALVAGLLVFAACSPAATPAPAAAPTQAAPAAQKSVPTAQKSETAAVASKPTAGSDAKTQWDKLLADAKKEGKVAVAGPPGDLWRDAMMEFQKTYPEIKLEFIGAPIPTHQPKIVAERQAGQYLWDVLINSIGGTTIQMAKAGYIAPLKPSLMLPEVLDDTKWQGGFDNGWTDIAKTSLFQTGGIVEIVVFVNRDFVPKAEFSNLDDLLNPKWKGKIGVRDLRKTAGSGTNAAALLLYHKGEDWLRKFMAQDLIMIDDERQQVEALVRGTAPIILGPTGTAIDIFHAQGAMNNVEFLGGADDPTTVYDSSNRAGLAAFNNAPNPNAQKVFINWLLSQKAQESVSKIVNIASRRSDVPPPAKLVEQGQAPKPGVQYLRMDAEATMPLLQKVADIANEYLK